MNLDEKKINDRIDNLDIEIKNLEQKLEKKTNNTDFKRINDSIPEFQKNESNICEIIDFYNFEKFKNNAETACYYYMMVFHEKFNTDISLVKSFIRYKITGEVFSGWSELPELEIKPSDIDIFCDGVDYFKIRFNKELYRLIQLYAVSKIKSEISFNKNYKKTLSKIKDFYNHCSCGQEIEDFVLFVKLKKTDKDFKKLKKDLKKSKKYVFKLIKASKKNNNSLYKLYNKLNNFNYDKEKTQKEINKIESELKEITNIKLNAGLYGRTKFNIISIIDYFRGNSVEFYQLYYKKRDETIISKIEGFIKWFNDKKLLLSVLSIISTLIITSIVSYYVINTVKMEESQFQQLKSINNQIYRVKKK